MSSFKCEHCGADCIDTDQGYITGCQHYPVDSTSSTLEPEPITFDIREPKVYTDNSKVNYNLIAEIAQIKRREAIAVKALEDLNMHYNTILRDAPWPSAAWHIVTDALAAIRKED